MNRRGFLKSMGLGVAGLFSGFSFGKPKQASATVVEAVPLEFAETPDPARYMRLVVTTECDNPSKCKVEVCTDPDLGDWREHEVSALEIDSDATIDLHAGTIQAFDFAGNPLSEAVPL